MNTSLAELRSDDRWWGLANCVDMDTDVFFPVDPDYLPIEAARACHRCVVREECFDHALRHEQFGIWAATTEKSRRRMRRAIGLDLDRPEAGPPPSDIAVELDRAGVAVKDIAQTLGVTRRTVHRYKAAQGGAQ